MWAKEKTGQIENEEKVMYMATAKAYSESVSLQNPN